MCYDLLLMRHFFFAYIPSPFKRARDFTLCEFTKVSFPFLQLAGLISISSRFLPTVMDLLRRLAAEAQGSPAPGTSRTSQHVTSQSFRSQVDSPNPVSSSVPSSSVSSNISTENDFEYTSSQLTQRRVTQVEQE